MKTRRPNDKYYRNKADDLFMSQFRGKPCEVCGSVKATVGHHNVSKARSKALRYDKMNITVLCQAHHTMGNDICPHSSNPMAVDRYFEWFAKHDTSQYWWIKNNEKIVRKYNYKQAWENMKEGREAWI